MSEPKPADLFVQLLTEELHQLKREAKPMSFRAGEIIFQQGDPGDGVYVVESGNVEISALVKEKQQRVLTRYGPGGFFGEMAVIDEHPRSATAIATADSALSFIPAAVLRRALDQSPQLLVSLVREFSHRVRQLDQRFIDELLQAERLALVGRFAQSIVHDFKNPLNMIGFAADAAASDSAGPELRGEARALIRRQVDRLAGMINELLEFTRGTSVASAREPVNYAAFIREALCELQTEARERGVEVVCENEPPELVLPLDAKRLLHVVHNFVNNAVDMMPKGGRIALRFSTNVETVTSEFADDGPGIAPEIAERLFEPFATHGKTHGTGLGLSICKRIIEDHEGRIFARSRPGGGAVFGYVLPR